MTSTVCTTPQLAGLHVPLEHVRQVHRRSGTVLIRPCTPHDKLETPKPNPQGKVTSTASLPSTIRPEKHWATTFYFLIPRKACPLLASQATSVSLSTDIHFNRSLYSARPKFHSLNLRQRETRCSAFKFPLSDPSNHETKTSIPFEDITLSIGAKNLSPTSL
jgi:hypothetical protein